MTPCGAGHSSDLTCEYCEAPRQSSCTCNIEWVTRMCEHCADQIRGRSEALEAAVRRLLRDLPLCDGERVSGSDSVRLHSLCPNLAHWDDGEYVYCDLHIPPEPEKSQVSPLWCAPVWWSRALRDIEALLDGDGERSR